MLPIQCLLLLLLYLPSQHLTHPSRLPHLQPPGSNQMPLTILEMQLLTIIICLDTLYKQGTHTVHARCAYCACKVHIMCTHGARNCACKVCIMCKQGAHNCACKMCILSMPGAYNAHTITWINVHFTICSSSSSSSGKFSLFFRRSLWTALALEGSIGGLEIR